MFVVHIIRDSIFNLPFLQVRMQRVIGSATTIDEMSLDELKPCRSLSLFTVLVDTN